MQLVKFSENYYSFRDTHRMFDNLLQPITPEQVALAAIEAKLANAHSHYVGRRYTQAIADYKAAEALIYAQLNPGFPYGLYGSEVMLPRHPALFDGLLSASTEWLNILPVRQPVTLPQPRVPIDAGLLDGTRRVDTAGLTSSNLAPGAPMQAAAELQLSKALTSQGSPSAGKFFESRAQQTDARTTELLRGGGAGNIARTVTAGVEAATLLVTPSDTVAMEALSTPVARLPQAMTESRTFTATAGDQTTAVRWNAGEAPPLAALRTAVYEQRVFFKDLASVAMRPAQVGDVALNLPHDYYYVIPLGLAECYHALGQFQTAESFYFQAAAYQYLNTAIEAPYLWLRLARLYLDWGNATFREDDAPGALPIYQRVLMPDDTAPTSTLYTTAALKPGADLAREVIAHFDTLETLTINPEVISVISEVRQQLFKIQGGLDFWGHWHNVVPIWTFAFLQSAALNFTQMAIGAERDFISFQEHADHGDATRQQIADSVTQANAEVNAAKMQAAAAAAETQVYRDAVALAALQKANASKAASDYAATSANEILFQAMGAQTAGGDNGDWRQLNGYADLMMGRAPMPTIDLLGQKMQMTRITGSPATLGASNQLAAARLKREYELRRMQDHTAEMNLAGVQAGDQLKAAEARTKAAEAGTDVARAHLSSATNALNAFDNQFFTPDVWHRMATSMWQLYQRYLTMALRTAKLMQQAYNFENDEDLRLIKTDYASDEVKGLLGADMLMADIQSFTYDLITTRAGKPQPMKQTISIAERFGFQFETQFRKTGVLEFATVIDDFDATYPGTYAGRIDAVEIDIDGIVPPTGLSGTLTNSGISAYRLPASKWADPTTTSGLKYRVQSKETLVLSDYALRRDGMVAPDDNRMLRVFQGAGLASTWRLELPRGINDLDFGALTDVRITFYYHARFDPDLRVGVLNRLASAPGIDAGQRALPLRWIYPDAFFHFQDTGELRVTLGNADFRRNETKPTLTSVGLLVATDGSIAASGLKLGVQTPGHTSIVVPTDPGGRIDSATNPALASLVGGPATGEYVIAVKSADNPGLVVGGKLALSPIVNVALILGYSFTRRA